MKKILVIGSSVLDITASPIGNRQQWEEKQRIQSITMSPGGDAVNQSIRLADLGDAVDLVCVVGKDSTGDFLIGQLKERGVGNSYIRRRDTLPTTSALVLVDEHGERHTFSTKGAHADLSRIDLEGVEPDGYSAISIASLFSMPRLEKDGLLEFLEKVHSLNERPLVFADLSSDKLHQGIVGIRDFLPYIDYFVPSLYDARQMTGKLSPEEICAYYRSLGCRNVIIKCGADGCFCLPCDSQSFRGAPYAISGFRVSAKNVEPVDTTGAGDTFSAFIIDQIVRGTNIYEAVQYATCGATLSTLYRGASSHKLTDANIQTYMRQENVPG